MLLSIIALNPENLSHQKRTLLLKCDICNREFSLRYKRAVAEKLKHYCDRKCSSEGKKINPGVPRIRKLTCQICGLQFEVTCNTNQTDPKTCSRSCASSLRTRELNLVLYMQTPDVRARAMKTRSEHWRDGTIVHGMIGKHIPSSEKKKALLREKNGGKNNPFFGKKHTDETKQKMREARSQLIISGKMNWKLFGHKCGTYTSYKIGHDVHFRSSWEELVMQDLDKSMNVLTWDYECVRIAYYYKGNKRWHIPDFLVTFTDGHRELWEVKPKEFVDAEKPTLKAEAARVWCVENNVTQYRIITGDDLRGTKSSLTC